MGGAVSLEQTAHDSLRKAQHTGWKSAVTRFNEHVVLDPSAEAHPNMKVNPKTYTLLMKQIDIDILENKSEFLIPMLMVFQRLLSMESFYRCLRTPIPMSLLQTLNDTSLGDQLNPIRTYVLDVIERILISRVEFNTSGVCKTKISKSEEAIVTRLEFQAKEALISVNVYQSLTQLLETLSVPLSNPATSNTAEFSLIASCLKSLHSSLLERAITTNYSSAKNIVDLCTTPKMLALILKLSIVKEAQVRHHALLLLKGVILHSPRNTVHIIQDTVLNEGYLLWYLYFSINKASFHDEHKLWNDVDTMNVSRELIGYLADDHKNTFNVVFNTLPSDFVAMATTKTLTPAERSHIKISEYYTMELSRQDLVIANSLTFFLYREGKLRSSLWTPVFLQLDLDHNDPTLVWDEYTRAELVDCLVLELEEFKLQRAMSLDKETAKTSATTTEQKDDSPRLRSWDHKGYSVQYESLNRFLKVQDYYVHILLPILESACESKIEKALVKLRTKHSEKALQSQRLSFQGKTEQQSPKKGKNNATQSPTNTKARPSANSVALKKQLKPLAIESEDDNAADDTAATSSADDVEEIEMMPSPATNTTNTKKILKYNIPADRLSGLVFACFQKAVIEDDVGWKLGCLRLMSALFETHKDSLQDADMIPYLIWLLAPKPTVDGALPEDVIRFLEKFPSHDTSGKPMDEHTMQQIQKIAINNPLWRDHILRFLDQLFTYNSNINRFVKSDGISTLIYYMNQVHLVNEVKEVNSPRSRALRNINEPDNTNEISARPSNTQYTFDQTLSSNSKPATSATSSSLNSKSIGTVHHGNVITITNDDPVVVKPQPPSGARISNNQQSQSQQQPRAPRASIAPRASVANITGKGASRILQNIDSNERHPSLFNISAIRNRQQGVSLLPRDNLLENVHGPEDNIAVARRALRLLNKIVLNAPRLRRAVFRDSLRTCLVQLLLCDDDVIISEALLTLDQLLEANSHAISDLAQTGLFLFGLYAMRNHSMSCVGVFMDKYHKLQSSTYAPHGKSILAPYFPPPMVRIIEEQSVSAAFKLLDSTSFSPVLIWDQYTRKALFDVVFERSVQFLTLLCNDPSLSYTYEVPSYIDYPTIQKELYIGNVYVRLFNANPNLKLVDSNAFLQALIKEMTLEKYAHLFEESANNASKSMSTSSLSPSGNVSRIEHRSTLHSSSVSNVDDGPTTMAPVISSRFSVTTSTVANTTSNGRLPTPSKPTQLLASTVSTTLPSKTQTDAPKRSFVAEKANQYLNVLNSRSVLAERFDIKVFKTIDKETSNRVKQYMNNLNDKTSALPPAPSYNAPRLDKTKLTKPNDTQNAKNNAMSSTDPKKPASGRRLSLSSPIPSCFQYVTNGNCEVSELMFIDESTLLTYNLMLLMRAQHIILRSLSDFSVVHNYCAIPQLLAILATSSAPFTYDNDLFRLGIRLLRCILVVPDSPNSKECVVKGGIPLAVRLITELGANIRQRLLTLTFEEASEIVVLAKTKQQRGLQHLLGTSNEAGSALSSPQTDGLPSELYCLSENIDLLAQLFMSLSIMLKIDVSGDSGKSADIVEIDVEGSPTIASKTEGNNASNFFLSADLSDASFGFSNEPSSPVSGSSSRDTSNNQLGITSDSLNSNNGRTTAADRLCTDAEAINSLMPYISASLRQCISIASPSLTTAVLSMLSTFLSHTPLFVPFILKHGLILDVIDLAINFKPSSIDIHPLIKSIEGSGNVEAKTEQAPITTVKVNGVDVNTANTPITNTIMSTFNVDVGYNAILLLSSLGDRTRSLNPYYVCFSKTISHCLSPGLLQELYVGIDNFISIITSDHHTPTLVWNQNLCNEVQVFLTNEIKKRNQSPQVLWDWGLKAFDICTQSSSSFDFTIMTTIPPFVFTLSSQRNYTIVEGIHLQIYSQTDSSYNLPSYVDPQLLLDGLCAHGIKSCRTEYTTTADISKQDANLQLISSCLSQIIHSHPQLANVALDNPYSNLRRLLATLMSDNVQYESNILKILSYLVKDVPQQWAKYEENPKQKMVFTESEQQLHKTFLFAAHDLHFMLIRKRVNNARDNDNLIIALNLINAVVSISMMTNKMKLLQIFWEGGLLGSLIHIIANPDSPPSSKKTNYYPIEIRLQSIQLLGRLCTLAIVGEYYMKSTRELFTPVFTPYIIQAQTNPQELLDKFNANVEESEFFWNENCRNDLRVFLDNEVVQMRNHHIIMTREYSSSMFQLRLEDEGWSYDEIESALVESQKNVSTTIPTDALSTKYEIMLAGNTEQFVKYPYAKTWDEKFDKKTLSREMYLDGVYVNVFHRDVDQELKNIDRKKFYKSLLTNIKENMDLYMWYNFSLSDAIDTITRAEDLTNSVSMSSQSQSTSQSGVQNTQNSAHTSHNNLTINIMDESYAEYDTTAPGAEDLPTDKDIQDLRVHVQKLYPKLCILIETLEKMSIRDPSLLVDNWTSDVLVLYADFVRCQSDIETDPLIIESEGDSVRQYYEFLSDDSRILNTCLRLLTKVAQTSRVDDIVEHRIVRYVLPLLFSYFDLTADVNEKALTSVLTFILTIFSNLKNGGLFSDQLHSLAASLFLLSIVFQSDLASHDLRILASTVIGRMCASYDNAEGKESTFHFMRFLTLDFEFALSEAHEKPEALLLKIDGEHKCPISHRDWDSKSKIRVLQDVIHRSFVSDETDYGYTHDLLPSILNWDIGSRRVFDVKLISAAWIEYPAGIISHYLNQVIEIRRNNGLRLTGKNVRDDMPIRASFQVPQTKSASLDNVFVQDEASSSISNDRTSTNRTSTKNF